MTAAEKLGRTDCVSKAVKAIKKAFEYGWDKEHGGLLRFMDKDGGPPKGTMYLML